MNNREEINLDTAADVTGGAYVTTSMTIGEIINMDRKLASVLAKQGIPVVGNKSMLGETLEEVASVRGISASALEDKLNDYLSGK